MTSVIKNAWNALGSIHLTVVLLLVAVVDMGAGFFCLRFHAKIFEPLNDIGLPDWASTYGIAHFKQTGWFFLLLGILFLLSVNMFACTTQRVFVIFAKRKVFPSRMLFALKLSPHIMHYAVVVILTGYLSSYLFSQTHPNNVLIAKKGGMMQRPYVITLDWPVIWRPSILK